MEEIILLLTENGCRDFQNRYSLNGSIYNKIHGLCLMVFGNERYFKNNPDKYTESKETFIKEILKYVSFLKEKTGLQTIAIDNINTHIVIKDAFHDYLKDNEEINSLITLSFYNFEKANLEISERGIKNYFNDYISEEDKDSIFTKLPDVQLNALKMIFKCYLDFYNYDLNEKEEYLIKEVFKKRMMEELSVLNYIYYDGEGTIIFNFYDFDELIDDFLYKFPDSLGRYGSYNKCFDLIKEIFKDEEKIKVIKSEEA